MTRLTAALAVAFLFAIQGLGPVLIMAQPISTPKVVKFNPFVVTNKVDKASPMFLH